jgi:hypothetical protein
MAFFFIFVSFYSIRMVRGLQIIILYPGQKNALQAGVFRLDGFVGHCLYVLFVITFSVVQGLPSAVQSYLAGQTVLSFFGTRKFINLFTKLHGCTLP